MLFIGIGVIAGLGFGVYLIDVKNTNQLIFVEGPSISLVTEKSDFKKGEEIIIQIVNSGTVPLTFFDDSYDLQITGLFGILMFSPDVFTITSTLDPGDETSFSWNQIKNGGDIALEGLYKISVKAIDNQGNNVEKSITITIWK